MSSLRTDMLALEDELYADLLSPAGLDQVVSQLTIRVRTWASGQIGVPNPSPPAPDFTDADLVIPQQYFIDQVTNTREVDTSGGRVELGDLKVKGIVPGDPANPGVGVYPSQLQPALVDGQDAMYLLTGPHNGVYALQELRTTDAYGYDLILRRRIDQPVVTGPNDASGGAHE
ncbi:MAG TPA: hypothetical protein VGI39_39685 [Polyangiaceae bacterium]|jgi:hypothetical protein